MKIRYFDHAATTAVRKEVLEEMIPYFNLHYGNPSALYCVGREAKRGMERAREKVASQLNCNPHEIYFTSCGSESDNLALKGIAYANRNKGRHIITSKIEHHAILNSCKTLEKQGFRITYLNVDRNGKIDMNHLLNSISDDTILISIMFANNEIGTIEPINEIGEIAHKNHILLHTDAVQAIGNIKINVKKMNIDLLSMSAHKFYGPKGVGAIYVRDGVDFDRIQDGGHQEKNKRAGTENVAEIVGLGKAIELVYRDFEKYNLHLKTLRNYYINQIEKNIPEAVLNGDRDNRLPGNANFSFKGIDAGELLLRLDESGICASAGSACSSGEASPSHVLTAIGLERKLSTSALRISFGYENTLDDVDFLIDEIKKYVKK